MENNLRNEAIHIEFYGLPGSGKSTISHIIAENLKNKGIVIVEPSYDFLYKISKIHRLIKKIVYMMVLLVINPGSFVKLRKLVSKNGYKGINLYKQVANIAYKIVMYKFPKKNCIYFWDEGLVQSAISLSMFNSVNSQDNLTQLISIVKKNVNIKKILLIVDNETAKKRLELREGKHSRVERMGNVEVEKILNKIDLCINEINESNRYIFEKNTQENRTELENNIIKEIYKNWRKNENNSYN